MVGESSICQAGQGGIEEHSVAAVAVPHGTVWLEPR